jgi:hypothetical protein
MERDCSGLNHLVGGCCCGSGRRRLRTRAHLAWLFGLNTPSWYLTFPSPLVDFVVFIERQAPLTEQPSASRADDLGINSRPESSAARSRKGLCQRATVH